MSYFFAIILICILIWMFFGDRIKMWAQRRMMEKMEDALRAQMGMPSAKEERKRRRQAEKQQAQKPGRRGATTYQHNPKADHQSSQAMGDVIIPREYAEDVEFVEYKEFSSSTTVIDQPASDGKSGRQTIITESQVTDVEYTEIKTKK
ncbi:MAG: hypothetical protein HDT05_03300 [Bacteroidales bacterium]|nr:hypothetical protein [Bacteroidales bacterium]